MDKKTTGIIAYITLIGWIVAYFAGDRAGAKYHLNQSIIVWIMSIISTVVGRIPFMGLISTVIGIFAFVCWLIGLINACKEVENPIPLVGNINILN